MWSYGAKALEPDGKTPAINSDRTRQVIELWRELYQSAMEPEVLGWNEDSNNRFFLSGKGSWIHNPISPYLAALASKQPIAADIDHHPSLQGPAGTHSAAPIYGIGIWKFGRSLELARRFVEFLFRRENFDAWIVAAKGLSNPALRDSAANRIWADDPKTSMLTGEARFVHPRGWPAAPSASAQWIDHYHILPKMVLRTIDGQPAKAVMEWAESQVVLSLKAT
jgi:multiple sugar transport system substrate-binding protein